MNDKKLKELAKIIMFKPWPQFHLVEAGWAQLSEWWTRRRWEAQNSKTDTQHPWQMWATPQKHSVEAEPKRQWVKNIIWETSFSKLVIDSETLIGGWTPPLRVDYVYDNNVRYVVSSFEFLTAKVI